MMIERESQELQDSSKGELFWRVKIIIMKNKKWVHKSHPSFCFLLPERCKKLKDKNDEQRN